MSVTGLIDTRLKASAAITVASVLLLSGPAVLANHFHWTVEPISTDFSLKSNPEIDGDWVVWNDFRDGNWDIWLRNLATGEEVPAVRHPAEQRNAEVAANGIVVWGDKREGNWDIYLKDMRTGEERIVAGGPALQSNPCTDGRWAGWHERVGISTHIFVKNLTSGRVIQVTNHPGRQVNCRIEGNRVTWADDRSGDNDIYMMDLRTRETFLVAGGPGDQFKAAIDGMIVAWEHRPDPDDLTIRYIHYKDLTTGFERRITRHPGPNQWPYPSGRFIAYTGFRQTDNDFFVYDIRKEETMRVGREAHNEFEGDISGRRAVWLDDRQGDYLQVFMATASR